MHDIARHIQRYQYTLHAIFLVGVKINIFGMTSDVGLLRRAATPAKSFYRGQQHECRATEMLTRRVNT